MAKNTFRYGETAKKVAQPCGQEETFRRWVGEVHGKLGICLASPSLTLFVQREPNTVYLLRAALTCGVSGRLDVAPGKYVASRNLTGLVYAVCCFSIKGKIKSNDTQQRQQSWWLYQPIYIYIQGLSPLWESQFTNRCNGMTKGFEQCSIYTVIITCQWVVFKELFSTPFEITIHNPRHILGMGPNQE